MTLTHSAQYTPDAVFMDLAGGPACGTESSVKQPGFGWHFLVHWGCLDVPGPSPASVRERKATLVQVSAHKDEETPALILQEPAQGCSGLARVTTDATREMGDGRGGGLVEDGVGRKWEGTIPRRLGIGIP